MQSDVLAKACEEANMPVVKFIVRTADGSIRLQEIPSIRADAATGEEPIQEAVCRNNGESDTKPKFKLYSVRKKTKRLHSCVECGELFANAYALKCHNSKTHTAKRLHPCLECGVQHETPLQLQDHLIVHFQSRTHTCPVCKEAFSNYGHLSQHLKIHYSKKQYLCDVCGKEFAYECNLKRHELTHIPEITCGQAALDNQTVDKPFNGLASDEVKHPEIASITVLFEDDKS